MGKIISWTINEIGSSGTGKIALVNPRVVVYQNGTPVPVIPLAYLVEFPTGSKIYVTEVDLAPGAYIAVFIDDNYESADEVFEIPEEADYSSLDGHIQEVEDKVDDVSVQVTGVSGQISTGNAQIDAKLNSIIAGIAMNTDELKRLLGLSNENQVEDLFVHDINGRIVRARIRIFDTVEQATYATKDSVDLQGARAAYQITAQYQNQVPVFYRSIRIA